MELSLQFDTKSKCKICNEYAGFVQFCAKLTSVIYSGTNQVTDQNINTCPIILILEDDRATLEELQEALSNEGFVILLAENIHTFERLKINHVIDLFLIDLSLPDGNGLTLIREIRAGSDVGIIIVSGKTSEIDRVVGLEVGADDYIIKPFSPRELLARVQAVFRRTHGNKYPEQAVSLSVEIAEFLDWKLDLSSRRLITKDDKEVELTTAEFDLLRAFVEAPNRVLSRDFLLNQLHSLDWVGYDRGVDGLVSRLRRKLKRSVNSVSLIKTVRSVGYIFTANVKKL
jgi:DNA-binding response OmpR family regulator